jgi:membrane protein implicated in regulation of membrane protease activity
MIVAGSGAVVAGRLVWNVPAVLYVGIVLVFASSLWNLWLKRPVRRSVAQPGAIPNSPSIEGEHP